MKLKENLYKVLKNKDFLIFSFLGICMLLGFTQCCETLYDQIGVPPDNPVEEALEDVLEHNTGIVIDLSPSTPEGHYF